MTLRTGLNIETCCALGAVSGGAALAASDHLWALFGLFMFFVGVGTACLAVEIGERK